MKTLVINLTLLIVSFSSIAQHFQPEDIDIPYKKFVLPNGLRLIVHEDHKAPIVAVNVWYHVGSKNEPKGKTGFAHLFEHLMFNGSENYNDDYFQALERIGATDLNGTTSHDRTNYFQNVPTAGLDQVLFLESDRMGHLLGAIDIDKLNEQRGVVQNEKREGENQPYGLQYELTVKNTYPEGHPYSWTVIGSMEDLDAASLEDVHEWFKTYYGPNNAVIVIAGNVDPDEVHQKVKKYFGHIPPGPTLAKAQVSVAKRTENTRYTYEDRVPEARILQVWNVPEWGNKESIYLSLAADVLSNGKSSRLYKKLQYEDQIVSSVYAYVHQKEIGSNFNIMANVKPGESLEEVEEKLNILLNDFLQGGPTIEELDRAKSRIFAGFIKGLERIGGFGGKSDILAENAVYGNDPEFYKKRLEIIRNATPQDVLQAAKKWLSDGKFTLVCTPFPTYAAVGENIDRSKLPDLGDPVASSFPDIQTATLKNGLKVMLAQRKDVPTVILNMVIDAGYATDKFSKPGTASIAMNMMDEGTKNMDALEINEKLQVLGASLSTYSDLDASYIAMSTLKPTLDLSLDLYTEVILNPSFPEKEFERLKNEQINNIKREKASPFQMALRVFPKFLYGQDHAYSLPLSGSGYEESVAAISLADIRSFYSTWIKPNSATLIVVGDITMNELTQKLEKNFRGWKQGKVPTKDIATVTSGKGNTLYFLDKPGSQQSVVIGGYLVEPYGSVSEIAFEALNNVLGGVFTSRINMNLREDKHWSYGAQSVILHAKGQRTYLVYASVQADKTRESVSEIQNEFKMIIGEKPVMEEEFVKNKENSVLRLPGRWETNSAVGSSLNGLVKYNLASDYWKTYDQRVRNLTLKEVRDLSKKIIDPDKLVWFIVGDKEKVLPDLAKAGFSQIVMIDPDGNLLTDNKSPMGSR
jgi:zinc protease